MMKFYGLLVIIFIVIISGCSRDSRKIVTVYSPHGKEMLLEFEKRFETDKMRVGKKFKNSTLI